MKIAEMIPTSPITTEKSVRRDRKRVLTSAKAGKIVPLAFVPLLREDRVSRGRMRINVEMMETAETLMNAIHVNVYAHFVPFLAFDRFNGMDQFNRSYKGIPETEGGSPIPFFTTHLYNRSIQIYSTAGIHARGGVAVNTAYIEAYNAVVNFRRKSRSTKLPLRGNMDGWLAEAFWHHTAMAHIVPDFDQAMIDGEVPLVLSGQLPLTGNGDVVLKSGLANTAWPTLRKQAGGFVIGDAGGAALQSNNTSRLRANDGGTYVDARLDPNGSLQVQLGQMFAEMQDAGVRLSLSNIEMAKKTAAFAKLRSSFSGIEDDHIIDLLMDGIRVPDEALRQPILLDRKSTIMGYSKRYASDAANLDESVTTGGTFVDISVRTPPMNTGGVIVITCEVVPEQLWERQKDYFLYGNDPSDLPDFTRDFLDPEKVAIVTNNHVDTSHTTPLATFGYAPLNHEWQRDLVNVGGKYFRPTSDSTFSEDRQKIWSVETPNPKLTTDFYLCSTLHQKVFADTVADSFEFTARGEFEIIGNTVFGKGLQEASGDYDALMDEVDLTRIDQPAAAQVGLVPESPEYP